MSGDPRQLRLGRAAQQLELELSAEKSLALLAFVDLLRRWNATYNLTALRDPDEMLVQHLFDCLAAVPPLRRLAPGGQRVLDVGSGGGLPGIVFAIVCPDLRITCVDTVGKKVAFLRQVVAELQLDNVTATQSRVEQSRLEPFDVITSRAFASLADLVRLTAAFVKPTGAWMAMKGKRPDDEIAALTASVEVFHVEPLTVPDLDAERCLVWIRPKSGL